MANADISPKTLSCQVCSAVCIRTSARQKYCPTCAVEVEKQKGRERYTETYVEKPKDVPCKECGVMIHKTARCQRFCEPCANKRRRDAKSKRRKAAKVAGGGKNIGDVIKCEDCGADTVKKSGNTRYCVTCSTGSAKLDRYEKKRGYRKEKPESRRARQARMRAENPEKIRAEKRKWGKSESGRAHYRKKQARKRKIPKYNLHARMSGLVRRGLKVKKGGRSWKELVSFTHDELRIHLERQFTRGMSWKNMDEWDIDHIVPFASFNFSTPEDEGFKACWALTNLRPLWSKENQEKSDKRIFLI